jgi:RND family efflux transporter MFP subunit
MTTKCRLLPVIAALIAVPPAFAQGGPPPAPVNVVEAQMTVLAPTLELPGTVVSRNDARLAAEVPGRLTWISEIGTHVAENETVAKIEDTYLRLQKAEFEGIIARDRSQKEFLEREVRRLRTLAKENIAAKNQLDQTESDLASAASELTVGTARLGQIEVQLAKTEIIAPFPGIVTERLLSPGEHTQPGDPVIRLVQPDALEVVARAPLASLNYVSEGGDLVVKSDRDTGSGAVRTIVPFGDGRSHLFELRVELPATPWRVGQSVRLSVPSAEPIEVLAVPRDALVLRREGTSVFRILEDDTAERVTVATGLGTGGMIQVTGGLSVGDRVVVRGAERLRQGQKVSILPAGAPAFEPHFPLQKRRDRYGGGGLNDDPQPFPDQPHRRDDGGFRHGDNVVHQRSNDTEVPLANGCPQTIGDGLGGIDRYPAALPERPTGVVRLLRLASDDPDIRGLAPGRDRSARHQPPATDRRQDEPEVPDLLHQLERRRPLPGDDAIVVVGMDR